MTLEQFRDLMERYRHDAEKYAASLKDTYLVLDRLHDLYKRLDENERSMADQILAEWTLSEDEGLRFDALALIDEFRVVSATPALQKLTGRLARSRTPGAPHELEKVRRIERSLSGTPSDMPDR